MPIFPNSRDGRTVTSSLPSSATSFIVTTPATISTFGRGAFF